MRQLAPRGFESPAESGRGQGGGWGRVWGKSIPGNLRVTCGTCPGRLQNRVDLELPDTYSWFHDKSLHVTVRGLFSQ